MDLATWKFNAFVYKHKQVWKVKKERNWEISLQWMIRADTMYLTLRQNICLWNADGLFNIPQHRNNSSHYLKYVSGKHKHQIWAFENSLFAHRLMRSHICEEINIFDYRNTLDRLTAPVTWVWNKVSQSFKTYQTAMSLFFQRKSLPYL